jgi:hypothetical protein
MLCIERLGQRIALVTLGIDETTWVTELGCYMLQPCDVRRRTSSSRTSAKSWDCLRHAVRCRRAAETSRDPAAKADYIDLENRWLRLAQSYKHTQRLTRFLDHSGAKRRAG